MRMKEQSGFAAQPDCSISAAAMGATHSSRNFDNSGGDHEDYVGRWRGPFPLPHSPLPSVRRGGSTSSKRRSIRAQRQVEQVNSIVDCLNEMYCVDVGTLLPHSTMAQHQSQHQLFQQLNRFKPSTHPCTAQEAVEELLRTTSTYDGEDTSNTVRAYDRDLVSLPGSGNNQLPLIRSWMIVVENLSRNL